MNDSTPQSSATPAPSPAGWARVQALSPGAHIHITNSQGTLWCTFQTADADSITCLHAKQTQTRLRIDIRRISVSYRGRSLLAGVAIGAAAGAVTGAALGGDGKIIGRAGLAGIFALPLAAVGGIIGAATDFSYQTVYRAP